MLAQLAVYEQVNEANGFGSDFQNGHGRVSGCTQRRACGFCLGSTAEILRLSANVSFTPASRRSGRIQAVPANLILVKNISVIGVVWGAQTERDPAWMSRH